MPERKLIYADTVVEKLSELILLDDHEKKVLESFVETCMAVDAVPVVRCKECVIYNTKGCAEGFGWCEAYDNGRMDNDFCSFGSKMDVETDNNLLFADMEEIIDATV